MMFSGSNTTLAPNKREKNKKRKKKKKGKTEIIDDKVANGDEEETREAERVKAKDLDAL